MPLWSSAVSPRHDSHNAPACRCRAFGIRRSMRAPLRGNAQRGPNTRITARKSGGNPMAAPNRLLRYVLAAVLAASFLASAAHAQKWSRAAPFPEASEELYGVAAGGKFYAFGGLAPGWVPKGLMYEYDPAGDTWTKKKNMALALHHPAWVQ